MATTPTTPSAARPLAARALVAVAVGGFVGTALRLGLDLALPHEIDQFALSTLIVNVVGAFLLGLAVAALWPRISDWARAGLGAGLLGSFTTFSALTGSVVLLAGTGDAQGAIITVVATLVLGFTAAALGIAAGRRAAPGAHPERIDEVGE